MKDLDPIEVLVWTIVLLCAVGAAALAVRLVVWAVTA